MSTRHLRYLALAGSTLAAAGLLAGCGSAHSPLAGTHGGGVTASPAPSHGLVPAPRQLSDRIVLGRTRARAGTPIDGTLTVANHGRTTVNLNRGCRPFFAVTLTGHRLPLAAGFPALCSREPFLLKPGTTRLAFTVTTTYPGCTSGRPATGHTPACLPGNRMPPLPPGRYRAVLPGSGDLPLPPATPVQVTLTSR
jgi:hypothetical protein